MEKNVMHTLDHGERVTSTYAEIYLDDEYCESEKPKQLPEVTVKQIDRQQDEVTEEWVSPSDLLIGILELKPPFTSRITRGITHEGILRIGNCVIEKERAKFLRHLTNLLHDNDSAWMHIQKQDKLMVANKVKNVYEKIFKLKSDIMQQELAKFFESSLQELEDHVRSEVNTALVSTHSNMVSDLNFEISKKLLKERLKLEEVLRKRYEGEVFKITKYYSLLLNNEVYRCNKLVNQALHERNDALRAFYKQIQAETFTTSMYVMCTERKKCRVKQFLLENIHSLEVKEKILKLKDKKEMLDSFKENERYIADINKEWEEKTKKVLQLFLKFLSFSLKLLPEQATFLLDLEKLFVLQLNEIKKNPVIAPSILIDSESKGDFVLEGPSPTAPVCVKDHFVIEGDLADSIPTPYGSRETLPDHVDLPFVRVERQFIYAKCQRIDEVRAFLESQICKCRIDLKETPKTPSPVPSTSTTTHLTEPTISQTDTISADELLLIDDIHRLHQCPVRGCIDWAQQLSFPNLSTYFDFSEENYARVTAILGKLPEADPAPELIKAKNIAYSELLFSATKDRNRHAGTQYSSQEDIRVPKCSCTDNISVKTSSTKVFEKLDLNTILMKRKLSLKKVIHENPTLLKMFTDESFDFQL